MEGVRAPRGEAARLDPSELQLDFENPRLPEFSDAKTQDDLVVALATEYSLTDLGRSMSENGFFEEEPLAAVPLGESGPPYVVVEGNRRLAALKLLTDAELRARVADRLGPVVREWDSLAAKAPSIDEIPVVLYAEREQLLTFMGYRHITGVQQWDPLAKARFVSSLIEQHGMDFEGAARKIGSRASHVREIYLAYRVYHQARDAGIDVSRVEEAYGVFSRTMNSAPLKAHMGLTLEIQGARDPKLLVAPVPAEHVPELAEVVSWTAGGARETSVIRESRQITDLGKVVAAPEALAALRATRDLASAFELTDGSADRTLRSLLQARQKLRNVLEDIEAVASNDAIIEAVEQVHQLAVELMEITHNDAHS